MPVIAIWFAAFVLTICIEAPVIWFIVGQAEWRAMRKIGTIVLANMATHPVVWFIFPLLPVSRFLTLAFSEIFAFVVEAWLYAMLFDGISLRRAALASGLANTLSFSVGYLTFPTIAGWLRQSV